MKIAIIEEAGFNAAMTGLSLSHAQDPERMPEVALRLCTMDGGHNKFLESLVMWLDVTAPRYWWQQFDTYRVGTTKQSGSTMHTLMNRRLVQDDFEDDIDPNTLERLNHYIDYKFFDTLKNELPEGFLQRRIVCTNYKVLRNIIGQRGHHKLKQWQAFCVYVKGMCKYPEFLKGVADAA